MLDDKFRVAVSETKKWVSIDVLVREYVRLERAGPLMKGLCPFHQEKTPSFFVYPDINDPHYHCFGCGAHGDVFTFLMKIEDIPFSDALRRLASRAHISIPDQHRCGKRRRR